MTKVSSSPERHTFQAESYKKKLQENPDDETAKGMVDWYDQIKQQEKDRILDPEWQQNNMEYDLRTTDWILEKVRANTAYAQNLYAAMCNRDFVKKEVFPLLRKHPDKDLWSCSWRYAGGIIADMRQEGDYIDWYCSGIRDVDYDEEVNKKWDERKYVPEGVVTDEIREDLLRLGWVVLDDTDDI